jgi:hypothetical protein
MVFKKGYKMAESTKDKLSKIRKAHYKNNPHPKGKDAPTYNQIEFKCEYCGQLTTQHPCQYNKSNHHFCSRKCLDLWRVGDNHPFKKPDLIEFNCTYCGELATQKRHNFDLRKENHFCSRECYNNYISDFLKGKNHYNWKGGITELRQQIRACRDYTIWKKAILERDCYICKNCGQEGGYLEVHHIIPFSTILEDNNISSLDDAYKTPILWDIDNGTTYCKICHDKLHREGLI